MSSTRPNRPVFALADANSFYASCEKVFRPDLRNSPVVVLSNNDGCVIAPKQGSQALGIRMAGPWFEVEDRAQAIGAVAFSSNYELYANIPILVVDHCKNCGERLSRYRDVVSIF